MLMKVTIQTSIVVKVAAQRSRPVAAKIKIILEGGYAAISDKTATTTASEHQVKNLSGSLLTEAQLNMLFFGPICSKLTLSIHCGIHHHNGTSMPKLTQEKVDELTAEVTGIPRRANPQT